jgi:F0F1-type ATP synthase assembly protein I
MTVRTDAMRAEPPENGDPPRPDRPSGTIQPGFGLVFDLGLRLAISVVLGLGLGLLVDGWLHTSPGFTLLGMVRGVAAAMYTIWIVARQSVRR